MKRKSLKTPIFTAVLLIIAIFLFAVCEPEEQIEPDKPVLVTNITMNAENTSLNKGDDLTLSVMITPDNAANKGITWESSNPNVVTVSDEGLLNAVSIGEAVITASAKDGSGIKGSITITVAASGSFRWNFSENIPGWFPYNTNDPAGTTMTTNAPYLNGMTLLGYNHPIRWMPEQTTPVAVFSTGCIQNTSDTNTLLEITNVRGPFKITFNYTNTGNNAGVRHPVLYINGNKVKDGDPVPQTNGLSAPRYLVYNYFEDNIVTVRLGAVGVFRLFDVILGDADIPVSSI